MHVTAERQGGRERERMGEKKWRSHVWADLTAQACITRGMDASDHGERQARGAGMMRGSLMRVMREYMCISCATIAATIPRETSVWSRYGT